VPLTKASASAWLLGGLGLACVGLGLSGCRGLRASTVPLGGKHEEEVATARSATPAASAAPLPTSDEAQASHAEDAGTVQATAPVASAKPSSKASEAASAAPIAAGSFSFTPYVAHQSWTRVFDLEFEIKVGPGGTIDMKMVSHQEARFEVLAVGSSGIDKLSIEYPVYSSKMTVMGRTQDTPEELAGKRYVVTFANGKPEVREASGATPPKKQADSVKDDAREPSEIEKALRELTQLAQKGRGDFSYTGAVALAGGEDEDTKVSRARASLQRVSSGPRGEKLALLDLGYTLSNAIDADSSIEVTVAGTLSVLDAPARYQTSTVQGPMELKSSQPGGMQGRGTIKVTTTYKY
jgi:hypothetical protein